jgi:hypothetical protein
MRLLSLCTCTALLLACGPKPTPPPPPPEPISTTYRIISGVSMGGTGAAALGFQHPEKFDGIAMIGGPFDSAYFGRMIDRFATGGFCKLEDLEALLAQDPNKLNDPLAIAACARPEPTTVQWEHAQDFNHWHYTSNGTNADRNTYLGMFQDITLAYGNMAIQNPDSPYAPPGVTSDRVKNPPADFCTNPVRVHNLYNAEYNPTGKYDAITFCDGQPTLYYCTGTMQKVDYCSDPANIANPLPVAMEAAFAATYCMGKGGAAIANKTDNTLFMYANSDEVDPCRQPTKPFTLALAYDLNGNGRRDYGEPLVKNAYERFDDVGTDGCADAFEDGHGGCTTTSNPSAMDPNHDNYDVDNNPSGTENNWVHEAGEPYRDDGLDGVPNTHDLGEGNGEFDMVDGLKKFLGFDGRSAMRKLDAKALSRLNFLADGGIRDVFNFGVMSKQLFSFIRNLRGETMTGSYRAFTAIPGMTDSRTGTFNPWNHLWSRVPHDILMLYGEDPPTTDDIKNGEGDHVGTPGEAVDRFAVLFNWAAALYPSLDRPATPFDKDTDPPRQEITSFDSTALGAKWEYAISLPPGYFAAGNENARYPVVYVLHGYGMDPKAMMGEAIITDTYTTDTGVKFRPFIQVFPNGRCCWRNAATGGKDCRESDDNGNYIGNTPGWARECNSGSFYVNASGYAAGDGSKYGDAFYELMDYVDAKYRTLHAAEVEMR